MVCSVCLFPIAGCGPSNNKVEVVIWHSSFVNQETMLNTIVSDFNNSQDKITVEAINQPSAGFANSIY